MRKHKHRLRMQVFLLTSLFLFTTVATGCEPLRKKFTRKKTKKKSDDFIPVLEPIEYPKNLETPGGVYAHHYNLFQVWHKDLMTAYQEKAADKKVLYLLNNLMVQLDEMKNVLAGEKQKQFLKLIEELQDVQGKYALPRSVRNTYGISRKMDLMGKEIRLNYNPKDIQESLIKQIQ